MAIIHCPECGQEVSDQAKKCVHCGASIFVCPECGKVSVAEGKCPECGYSAVPKKIDTSDNTNEKKEAEQTPKNVFERWKDYNTQANNREKVFSMVSYGLWGLEIVFIVVWCIQVLQQYLHIDLQSLLTLAVNHKSNLDRTDTYFIIIIILDIITCAFDSFKDTVNYFSCAKWIRQSKVDIGGDIATVLEKRKEEREKKKDKGKKEEKDEDEDEETWAKISEEANETKKIEDLESVCFLAVDPNKSAFFAITEIVPRLFLFAFIILMNVCLKNNAISFMNSVIHGDFVEAEKGTLVFTYNYSFEWLTLVVGGVIAIALIIATSVICSLVQKKKIEKTLQKVHNAKSK